MMKYDLETVREFTIIAIRDIKEDKTCIIPVDPFWSDDYEIIEGIEKTASNFNYRDEIVLIAGYEVEHDANGEVNIKDAVVIGM